MKKICYLIGAGTMLLLAAACSKDDVSETTEKETGRTVSLTASIDDENNSEAKTRATLSESNGAFAFSQHDEIKVFDGTKTYEGRTTTAGNNNVEIEMAAGFTLTGSGYAGFPASMVSSITASGVTFVLPTSYEYAEVGGADPDASKVPCPMVATYNSVSPNLVFRQVGAVVRFRVTNCAAGSLTFTFPTNVTGTTAAIATPTTAGEGGITGFASGAGNSITVTGVPAVADGSYIYITLPVINGTAPEEILVTNTPAAGDASLRMVALPGNSNALTRAGGYKLGVALAAVSTTSTFKVSADPARYVVLAPGNLMAKIATLDINSSSSLYLKTATASEWKFGGPFEYIGDAHDGGNYLLVNGNDNCVGKWVDLLAFQGASAVNKLQGLFAANANSIDYTGTEKGESLYEGCWSTGTNNPSPAPTGYIHITNGGDYTWRPLTSAEWIYLITQRDGAKVDDTDGVLCSRAQISGVNGLLIFPDKGTEIWNTSTMGTAPSEKLTKASFGSKTDSYGTYTTYNTSYTWGTDQYTASQFMAMHNAGIVFLPAAGCRQGKDFPHIQERGYYWSSNTSTDYANYAYYMGVFEMQVCPNYPVNRYLGRSVRLVREVSAP